LTENETRITTDELVEAVRAAGEQANHKMSLTHAAREVALTASRQVIRFSATSIRASHRHDFKEARSLKEQAGTLLATLDKVQEEHPEVFYGGFVEDGQKEYVEACATLAFTEGSRLPTIDELGIGAGAYMNGLAEAIGELRRFVLDILRKDDFTRCEDLLRLMDEVYSVLVTLDYPDAVTRGLRRNTDVMRGVIERTRGDLTVALRQQSLERQLAKFTERLSRD
jgi:translin